MNLCCCHEVISINFCDLLSDVEWSGVGTHFAGRSELTTYVNFVKVIIAYNGTNYTYASSVFTYFFCTSGTFIT